MRPALGGKGQHWGRYIEVEVSEDSGKENMMIRI
jgi:hypothetical protein